MRSALAISESQLHQIAQTNRLTGISRSSLRSSHHTGEIIIVQHKSQKSHQKQNVNLEHDNQIADIEFNEEDFCVQSMNEDAENVGDSASIHSSNIDSSESLCNVATPTISEINTGDVGEDSQEDTVSNSEQDQIYDLVDGNQQVQLEQTDLSFQESSEAIDESSSKVIPPKIYKRNKAPAEVHYVATGKELKVFLANHPLLKGLYLNRGKRGLKRHLVSVRRDESAVDCISWKRGRNVLERNRYDDHFELTDKGEAKMSSKCVRDEYVVNWYLWCPGHGNCYRKCGEYGGCVPGRIFTLS